MPAPGILEQVRGLTFAGRWHVDRRHGEPRMRERGLTYADVEHGLLHASAGQLQDNGRWKLNSDDLDGDELTLIVHVDDEVLVVTLF